MTHIFFRPGRTLTRPDVSFRGRQPLAFRPDVT